MGTNQTFLGLFAMKSLQCQVWTAVLNFALLSQAEEKIGFIAQPLVRIIFSPRRMLRHRPVCAMYI